MWPRLSLIIETNSKMKTSRNFILNLISNYDLVHSLTQKQMNKWKQQTKL